MHLRAMDSFRMTQDGRSGMDAAPSVGWLLLGKERGMLCPQRGGDDAVHDC
jgi:hypothetical protein